MHLFSARRICQASSPPPEPGARDRRPTKDLPWMWCYKRGIECNHPELPGLCGDWLKELITVQPPFRLQ